MCEREMERKKKFDLGRGGRGGGWSLVSAVQMGSERCSVLLPAVIRANLLELGLHTELQAGQCNTLRLSDSHSIKCPV